MRFLQDQWRQLRSSSLARNSLWMLLGQGTSILCQGAYFILLGRLLGPVEYGIYAGVFAMVTVLSAYSTLGSQFTFLRYVSPDPEKFALYWGNLSGHNSQSRQPFHRTSRLDGTSPGSLLLVEAGAVRRRRRLPVRPTYLTGRPASSRRSISCGTPPS